MEWETSRIIDSNGQKFRVGWDDAGWFSIQYVRLYRVDDSVIDQDSGMEVIEYEGDEYFVAEADQPVTGFPPTKVDDLVAAIEER